MITVENLAAKEKTGDLVKTGNFVDNDMSVLYSVCSAAALNQLKIAVMTKLI